MPLASISDAASTTAATARTSAEQAKLRKAAQAFEAVFLRQMIGSMRTSSLGDGLFDSSASDQFRDMADSKLADSMAQKGALHIADMLVKQFGARVSPQATAGTVATTATKGEAK